MIAHHLGPSCSLAEHLRDRALCYGRTEGKDCHQPSAFVDLCEEQVRGVLAAITIPEDDQTRFLDLHEQNRQRTANPGQDNRGQIEARLERIKELYEWGDYTRERYLTEKSALQRQLAALAPPDEEAVRLDRLAHYLRNLGNAWADADPEQRNRLARRLLREVWVDQKRVVAVKPQPEFVPFFDLQVQAAEGCTGGSDGEPSPVRPLPRGYRELSPCCRSAAQSRPIQGRYLVSRSAIPPERWPEVRAHASRHGLRAAARLFGVSHEAVRQITTRIVAAPA